MILSFRLLISLVFVILSFTFTSIMVKVGKKINNELQKQKNLVVQVDTDGWQETFLYLTLGSVAFINVNAAIFQVRSSPPL